MFPHSPLLIRRVGPSLDEAQTYKAPLFCSRFVPKHSRDIRAARARVKPLGFQTETLPAVRYAKAILKHVAIQDKRPDFCFVKYQNGKVISVVSKDP